jgi:hypothetical protein
MSSRIPASTRCAVRHLELAQEVRHELLRRLIGYAELPGDLLVLLAA